ncbi:diaminopimelate decarboxylase [Neolewinella aurantiaca]|uniref:Diaminopimelate decarboxylase n=1 Tax=Neolewinella aurantiaca TaxID=2602767 RepID=A0A5C7F5D3_9BACT|nr:diaminopimelate decarboxylase [Neolewinella aurantiaca]TXF83698.1 diaminopimelate decarboxylase [Neolewinella aurantiaca]
MTLQEGRYQIGGADALEIVERFGAPVYVYDAATMKRQYKRMTSAFSKVKRLRINFACKALTNLNVLRVFRELGSGLDTVSIQEVEMGLLAGFEPHDILFTPNCVSLDEISQAVAKGVRINIDNIEILEQFGDRHPEVPVCIRINPHIMAGGNSKISVGHIDSKFGISIHQVPHVLKVVEAMNLKIEGLHMHTGSDIYDAQVFLRAVEILLSAAADFPDLDYLDFGSGFKVPYKEGGIATDIEDLGEQLGDRFNEFCGEYGRDLELMFEPGKFLVSEAGYFLVKTNVVKTTTASVFAGVDSGLNHLIRPMFYEAYHHITNLSNPGGKTRIYNVVGYICETDTFGINRQLSEVREGDILAMANAGAYSFMMASNYNSRFRPAEVMVIDGEAHLIRRRETMEDLLGTQVDLNVLKESVPA